MISHIQFYKPFIIVQ
ncbi:hypothetical protein F383_30928 [Gossypium arboreum]|uniref:Uncharacterized protein n=1 Tax=Gossypium arboreum TaxID=29729 RepID=A0A0B0MXX5_GOSAR|nr:hypothetical protein F383_30928 [Gossypium arboreum]